MRKLAPILAALFGLLALAGCGGSPSGARDTAQAATTPAQPAAAQKPKGPKLTEVESDYGRILADGRGRALYLFTADTGGGSTCSGDCAAAWPPWIVKRRPQAAAGARGKLIGTTRRDDGRRQATYRGHPLYYYVGDRAPAEVKCQAVFEYGGYWYVVRSSGRAVR
jgi:predicted lipoprotein with Yx(FWY)xxD motif